MSWPPRITHGGSKEPLYRMWATMLSRCRNSNFEAYKDYGARGIIVCPEWLDYSVFRSWAIENGYKKGLEIDRKNVNGNYEPTNCQWKPRLNNLNKRNNRYITAFGETKELAEWARDSRCVVAYHALKKRLNRGMLSEQALTMLAIPTGKYPRRTT